MSNASARLRLDRRLARRRGWISDEDLAAELEALPDVAEKAELVDVPGGSKDEAEDDASPEGSAE